MAPSNVAQDLIVMLYESLMDEEQRAGFLAEFLKNIGGSGATWFTTDHGFYEGSFLSYVGQDFEIDLYLNHFFERDDWHRHAKTFNPGSVMLLDEAYNRTNLKHSECFNDFCLPYINAAHICCANIDPSSDSHLSIYRGAGEIGFSARETNLLTGMMPHLECCRQMHSKIGLLQQQIGLQRITLDKLKIGLSVVDKSARIVDANQAMEQLFVTNDQILSLNNRLVLKEPFLDIRLKRLISQTCSAVSGDGGQPGGTIEMPSKTENEQLLVTVLPSILSPTTKTTEKYALVAVRPKQKGSAHHTQSVRTLFGLTQAEAAIADLMVQGHTVSSIACLRDTSIATVQKQVKSILAKSNSARQQDFIRQVDFLYLFNEE